MLVAIAIALAVTIAVACVAMVVASTVAVIRGRRYATTIVATIHKPEARIYMNVTLTDAQSRKVTVVVKCYRGKINTTDVATWSTSDLPTISLSPTDPNPANPTTPDPLGRVMWLVGEGVGSATVTITCAGGTLPIAATVSAGPASISATVDPPADLPPLPNAPVVPATPPPAVTP
jgi:hypothetical protein